MLENIYKIPTEVIQLLSSAEANSYHVLPYNKTDNIYFYYSSKTPNEEGTAFELEVILGTKIVLTLIEDEILNKLLLHYYRESKSKIQNISFTSGAGFVTTLIEEAYSLYASDIHLEIHDGRCRIRFRIDGKLIEKYIIESINYMGIVNQIKILSNLDISEKRLPQDGRILHNCDGNKFDVRVSTLPTIYGEKVVMRLLTRHSNLLVLENLGFDDRQLDDYKKAISNPNGLILISGPTGSGKSTTLYATLIGINKEDTNILTIEDPVEYTIKGVNQVQLKEEIGLTFGHALRTFLRQDPDVIMLGEIRDSDTASMAIRSSLTGHLVFSTIHTNSAWGCVSRLVDMGAHPYLISETLRICIAQRLVRILCPHCKEKLSDTSHLSRYIGNNKEGLNVNKAVGCQKCFYTGYSGRKALYEVIPIDEYLSEKIREGCSDINDYLDKTGVSTLRSSAISMLKEGLTSFEEIIPLIYN